MNLLRLTRNCGATAIELPHLCEPLHVPWMCINVQFQQAEELLHQCAVSSRQKTSSLLLQGKCPQMGGI